MLAKELNKVLKSKFKRKSINELIDLISVQPDDNQNYCLFLGAGASKTSSIETAFDLINKWRCEVCHELGVDTGGKSEQEIQNKIYETECDWYDIKHEYSSLFEKKYSLPESRRKFIEKQVSKQVPSIGYAYLVRLAESAFIRTIFTTNFDDLLNEAFYQFSTERPLVCAHDSSVSSINITSRRTKIIKLHGDYLYNNLKSSLNETAMLEKNMQEKLEQYLKEYGLIFVGYSGMDKSITNHISNILKQDYYLENGLFWCFRENDYVNEDVIEILKNEKCFYVLIDGFDELMSILYTNLISKELPFNNKLAIDRSTKIIESYLENDYLVNSSCEIIKSHLDKLDTDKVNSKISDAMSLLRDQSLASSGLKDKDFLFLVELYHKEQSSKRTVLIDEIDGYLSGNIDLKFKKILLDRKYHLLMKSLDFKAAEQVTEQLITYDENNYFIHVRKASTKETRSEKIETLESLSKKFSYSAYVINLYADSINDELNSPSIKKFSKTKKDVIDLYEKSRQVNPTIDNPAIFSLFLIYLKDKELNVPERENKISNIIEECLVQNPYGPGTMQILLEYCKEKKVQSYENKNIFEYLNEAYEKHFQESRVDYIDLIVEACIEFDQYKLLKEVLLNASRDEELIGDENFALTLMKVYHDIFRDKDSAIQQAKTFLKNSPSVDVSKKLFGIYIRNKLTEDARKLLQTIKQRINIITALEMEAEILESECKYQDAIDIYESIPDKRNFDEKYLCRLAFIEMKMGKFQEAKNRLVKFLNERNFNKAFSIAIINFEFVSKKLGKNVNKKRLQSIISQSSLKPEIAVAHLLCDEAEQAWEIIESECRNNFSQIIEFKNWPVLEIFLEKLIQLEDELKKSKRTLETLE